MGKAVNLMTSGGRAKNVPNTETPAVSRGGGGIPATLKIKAAGIKAPNVQSGGLASPKLPQGEKINNLF